ncbi:MAG: response regulator [Candidatus Brocadiaceae bacterium]|nr:response regulator [Candidatus Brocadiaceae bacterium]
MTKKLLIVDDSPIARKMTKKNIPNKEDFEVFEATNGLEGLNKFKEISPDITFMDLTMPVMDGLEALEEIIKIDKNAIVVVSTADVQPKSISKVMSLGAFDVIRKPPKLEKIEEVMLEALKKINSGG